MSDTTLGVLARTTGGRLVGADIAFTGVSTDSRTVSAGQLFVALSGPRFDGHEFVGAAGAAGALGALVEREVEADLSQVVVEDTRHALGVYAAAWRRQFTIPVVGLTGSNGKTTTKEMITSILACRGPVLSTRGNLNNDIGVPLTLLGIHSGHMSAVVEMGANHSGEIAYLAGLAAPTVGLVTNAGPAHLEGFGSIEGVAHAKGEIYQGLSPEGCAVINANDIYAPLWRGFAGDRRKVEFGVDVEAEFSVDSSSIRAVPGEGQQFELRCASGSHVVTLPLPGRHNIHNALAAIAAAAATGASSADFVRGLAAVAVPGGRLRRLGLASGAVVIDDTYNANPASLRAAIDVLVRDSRRTWLVLGDMGELGPDATALHIEAGEYARQAGVERLFALGTLARGAVKGFGAGSGWFEEVGALSESVRAELESGVTVLVKGSRGMRMERVVAALCGQEGEG